MSSHKQQWATFRFDSECVIIDYEYESGISSHLCYQGSLSFLLLTKRRGDLRDCCEKCLSGAHELGLKAPTQSPTRNRISGCVQTITDSFSYQSEKVSGTVRKLIRYVTFHLRDRRDAASRHYRNRSEITFLMCEQKPYPVWFSCRRKRYRVYSVNIA